MTEQHRLSNVDRATLTADCQVCGKGVRLVREGRKVHCRVARRTRMRNWRKRHPHPNTGTPRHRLRGGTTCPACGPVTPVPWGRGWMCPNRLAELGWVAPDEPEPRCDACGSFLTNGVCRLCLPATTKGLPSGWHVGELALTGRPETAVPGWKVIGEPLPAGSPWAGYLT